MVPREAFGISLAAVGVTALIGVIPRLYHRQVDIPVGLIYAVGGMIGAPIGKKIADQMSEQALLSLFAAIMIVVAWRMWPQEGQPSADLPDDHRSPVPAWLIASCGLFTGILSGMFGVGGGFVIVPALVLFTEMPIHRAVATSLFVIVLISMSGVTAHFRAGGGIPLAITGQFVVGGVMGLALGAMVTRRLSGPALQKIFALCIVAVAIFVVSRDLLA